jgi:hypothetical protein
MTGKQGENEPKFNLLQVDKKGGEKKGNEVT